MTCECCGVSVLAVALEAQVVRALERVGNRVVRRSRREEHRRVLEGVAAHEVYLSVTPTGVELDGGLEGCWVRVPELCSRFGVAGATRCLMVALDRYARRCVELRARPDVGAIGKLVHGCTRASDG